MNSFKMLIKVKKCDNDSKKICLIQQFASEMDSLTLGKAIAEIKDLSFTKKLIYKYQFKLCLKGILEVIINKQNDFDKACLIQVYSKDFDRKKLCSAIYSIHDLTYTNNLINEYRLKLGSKGVLDIIVNKKSDDDRIFLINEFASFLENWRLGVAIGQINDLNITKQLIEKYKIELGPKGLLNIIGYKKHDYDKKILIHKYVDILPSSYLGIAIGSLNNLTNTFELIQEYNLNLQSEGILNVINYKKSDYDKLELIKKYEGKLEPLYLGMAIGSLKDFSKTNKLVKKYQSKLGEKGIFKVIDLKKNDSEKIDFIKEYSDVLKIKHFSKNINSNNIDKKMKKIEKKLDNRCERKYIFNNIVSSINLKIKNVFERKKTSNSIFTKIKNEVGNLCNKIKEVASNNFLLNKFNDEKSNKPPLTEKIFNFSKNKNLNTVKNIDDLKKETKNTDNNKLFQIVKLRKPKNKMILNKKVVSLSLTFVMSLSATAMALNNTSDYDSKKNDKEITKTNISTNGLFSNFKINLFNKKNFNKQNDNIEVNNSNLQKENIKKINNNHQNNSEKTNETPIINKDKPENIIINIDDTVTVDADYIYTDVFKAKDRINGLKPSFDNNMQRSIKGALVEYNHKYFYSIEKDELEMIIRDGGIVVSYVVGNEYGYEGAYNAKDVRLVESNYNTQIAKTLIKTR